MSLGPKASVRLDPCAGMPANQYGQYVVQPDNHQSHLFGAGSRSQRDYTMGTQLRPAPATS